MILNASLRHSGAARRLMETAVSKGYQVEFGSGSFPHDLKMHEGWDCYGPLKNHTLRSASTYISDHPGVD